MIERLNAHLVESVRHDFSAVVECKAEIAQLELQNIRPAFNMMTSC